MKNFTTRCTPLRATLRFHVGVSLVELMVALLIGSILMAAALAVFVESRSTAQVNRSIARIQENALFAADEISRSLELAGYWGENNNSRLIGGRTERVAGALATKNDDYAADDCTEDQDYAWHTDLDRPIFGLDSNMSSDARSGRYTTCIPNSTYLSSGTTAFGASDILVVRFVEPEPVTDLQDGVVYIRSAAGVRPDATKLFLGQTPPGEPGNDYRLRAYAYYISSFYEDEGDGIPTLKRASLEGPTGGGTTPRIIPGSSGEEDIVIPGIESFHVQFGLDTDGDGDANQYLNANRLTDADWDAVIAVRFWLVARAESAEKDFENSTTYGLPHADVAFGTAATPSDAFRRLRVTRTIRIRNVLGGST